MFVVDVEGVIERDGQYLMIVRGLKQRQAPGALGFPGGKLEATDGPQNALEATLRREIREEVGVEVEAEMTYIESHLFDLYDGRKALAVVLLCRYQSGTPAPVDPEEVDSVQWKTADEVLSDNRARHWLKRVITLAERSRLQAV